MSHRPRLRDLGITIGRLPTGPLNALVDVPGVRVGHVTLIAGEGPLVIGEGPVRTGVTAILLHSDHGMQRKGAGAAFVLNGFGKCLGLPQLAELGTIETPILLTNTLNVWRVADALVDWMAERNPGVYSFNPIVGECNDSYLNDILGRHVRTEHVRQALERASDTETSEGSIGAGTGMGGFGYKAGVGTSSRVVRSTRGEYTLGALVVTNTGAAGDLRIDGRHLAEGAATTPPPPGSIMMIVGTDAPLDARQLGRLARRAPLGLARAGGIASHGSGDFVIAFSNAPCDSSPAPTFDEGEEAGVISDFFRAAVEAVEEAILNSILRSETMTGRGGHVRRGIPLEAVRALADAPT
jgi:D-aminopeptidase